MKLTSRSISTLPENDKLKMVDDSILQAAPSSSYGKHVPFSSLTCSKSNPPHAPNYINTNDSLFENQKQQPQQHVCEKDYGCSMLHTWKEQEMIMCVEKTKAEAPALLRTYPNDPLTSQLTCYKHNNQHLPMVTFPHTVCDGKNIVFDFSKLIHAPCLKYRPGYFCKKPTYYNYQEGALIGNCRRTHHFQNVDKFPKDFGKDIFSSFTTLEEMEGEKQKPVEQYYDGITIFVSREQDEHVNMFHAMTDFFATFVMIEMFELDSSNVQIVLLDDHYDGPYDFLWNSVFSFKRPMMKASQFNKSIVRFERAIFQHAGYATHFLSHLMDFNSQDPNMCNSKSTLVSSFANRVLTGLGFHKRQINRQDIIKVLFISRKPYVKGGVNHQFMGRQISNEDEVIERLKQHPQFNVKFVIEKIDFAHYTLVEQIQKVHHSDFLIGYHGAGLTHSLWLTEDKSAVLEIWKHENPKSWRCFEQFTLWKGNYYGLWTNTNSLNLRSDHLGDYLKIEPDSIYEKFSSMINHLVVSR